MALLFSEQRGTDQEIAYNINEHGNSSSIKFFRDIELWRFYDIMILEDSSNDWLSR